MEMKVAALYSLVSNSIIFLLKIIAGYLSGSIGIVSEAIHSASDILASFLTFFAVSKADEPADKEHPFGHGKYEDMSGFLEGGLIIFAGIYIISEAVKKLFLGHGLKSEPDFGIYVMAISFILNIITSSYLFYVAKKRDSISLYADAQHISSDVISSLGVLIGLLIIKYTGLSLIDPIIGIIVACIIIKTGLEITKKTLNDLLDGSLPQEDLSKIEKILNKTEKIKGYKNLRGRRLGRCKAIEITLLFPSDMNIKACHDICDRIEEIINKEFLQTKIMIHAEPFLECEKANGVLHTATQD